MVTVNGRGRRIGRCSAFRIAQSIANSPLVKTAIAGEDANWGRVVMAVGKAGEPADRDKLSIAFGDFTVAENGERAAGYDEAAAIAYMKNEDLDLRVGLGLGDGQRHGLHLRSHPRLYRHQRQLPELRWACRAPIEIERAGLKAWPGIEVEWDGVLGAPGRERLHPARQFGAEPRS